MKCQQKNKKKLIDALKNNVLKNFSQNRIQFDAMMKAQINKINQQNKIQIPFILRYLKQNPVGITVLDVGCGTGGSTVAWALRGAKCIGIDILPEDLQIGRMWAKHYQVKANFVEVKTTKIPFKNNLFDIIICDQVLEHIPNYKETIKEIKRVAKKNAIIYLDIPNKYFPFEPHYRLFFVHWLPKNLQKKYIKLRSRSLRNFPLQFLSYKKIKREIEKNNLKIIGTTKDYIKNNLDNSKLRNILAKTLNYLQIPHYLFSPTLQFVLKKEK